MEIDLHAFGAKLQSIRLSRGLTQEQLADYASLSPHYIGNLEQGIKKPSITTMMKLCNALGTTLVCLFEASLSPDMLSGIPKPVEDPVTFRNTYSAFAEMLSDLLPLDDGESPSCFIGEYDAHSSESASDGSPTLTDLLLQWDCADCTPPESM